MQVQRWLTRAAIALLAGCCVQPAAAQAYGILRGTVTLERTGDPLHHASILVVQLGRSTETNAEGVFEFQRVPPGKYEVVAHMHPLTDVRRTVVVVPDSAASVDFQLRIAPVHEEITVTASGKEQTTLEAFQSVVTLENLDLSAKAAASLGEALDHETGVAKRSFGPGSSRPVVRGFDGDRVLILQDGLPTGTLSSQSGDHGEPVDLSAAERVEVVRGPATLLYGSNAIGGVVNVLTGHHQIHRHPHEGLRGFLSGSGGSNNAQGGGSGGFEYGAGKWMISGSGGGLRTGDYHTPLGRVVNSETEMRNAAVGAGRYGDKGFFHLGYNVSAGVYGVPVPPEEHGEPGHEEEGSVDLDWRRHNVRFTGSVGNISSLLDHFTLNLNYSDWNHQEIAGGALGSEFFNKQFSYRGVFDQKRRGQLSGSFGFSGLRRSYRIFGEEQLTPPVTQDAVAVYGLEEIDAGRFRLQFGGRLETNRYNPEGLRSRAFTGFSGSAAINAQLWKDGAVLAAYNHSFRAPAMEELYNFGPHHGNLAFEIGNPDLEREAGDGVEVALRHKGSRLRGELSLFYYLLNNFVFLAPTGEFEDGLVKANYSQADSRYLGAEARLDLRLHSDVWMKLGFDSVDAELRRTGAPLPRIPPVRGRIGFDAHYKGFGFQPELLLANGQHQLFFNETPTAGYAVLNLGASYTVARQHALHVFSLNVFNAGDRLYRNHVSLIKEFAPEIGRGARFAYTMRFF